MANDSAVITRNKTWKLKFPNINANKSQRNPVSSSFIYNLDTPDINPTTKLMGKVISTKDIITKQKELLSFIAKSKKNELTEQHNILKRLSKFMRNKNQPTSTKSIFKNFKQIGRAHV